MGTTMVAVAVPRWMLPAPHIDGRSVPGDVPARVDLDALGLEVAHLVGHRELRGHLRVAHEPGVDLGDLGLALGERRRALAATVTSRVRTAITIRMTRLLSDEAGVRRARPPSTRRSAPSSRALTTDPRSPSTRAPMTIWAGLKKTRPSMIRWPSPASAPMNSAPTMTKRASAEPDAQRRRRCRAARRAAPRGGRASARVAPRLAAARSSITSTRSTLAAMATNIGKKVV